MLTLEDCSALHSYSGSIILSIAYGIEVESENDPYVALVEQAMDALNDAARSGVYLVDSLPWLRFLPKWLPGARFQRSAERFRKVITSAPEVPFQYVKEAMVGSRFPYKTRTIEERNH
jgi:hypothetical protein